jgi:hypothetical protein
MAAEGAIDPAGAGGAELTFWAAVTVVLLVLGVAVVLSALGDDHDDENALTRYDRADLGRPRDHASARSVVRTFSRTDGRR